MKVKAVKTDLSTTFLILYHGLFNLKVLPALNL